MTEGFDWPALMRAAVQGLGLRPVEFWALTPAELKILLGTDTRGRPLDRGRLDELMSAFPDANGGSSDGD